MYGLRADIAKTGWSELCLTRSGALALAKGVFDDHDGAQCHIGTRNLELHPKVFGATTTCATRTNPNANNNNTHTYTYTLQEVKGGKVQGGRKKNQKMKKRPERPAMMKNGPESPARLT